MINPSSKSDKIKILLIEDNPGDSRLIKEYLSDVNGVKFELKVSDRLESGISQLKSEEFHTILLDLNLPDSNGLESFEKVLFSSPQVPIIILTGLNDETTALKAVQKGAQDYIVKDKVEPELLTKSIRYSIERKRAEEEHQKLIEQKIRTSAIIEAQENERRRISRELHDGLGQLLSAAKLNFGMIDLLQGNDKEKSNDLIKQIDGIISKAIVEARRISHDLRPTTLDDFGLVPSLRILSQEFSKLTNIKIKFQVSQLTERINSKAEIAIYRIVQESFNNILKYAKATSVTLDLFRKENRVYVIVKDNGIGFDMEEISQNRQSGGGLGLINMRERAELVGGKLNINSALGKGTEVIVEINLDNYY
jgi:signal transduction histidine kinase